MADSSPTIEFFEGVYEELSDVSLRRDRATGTQTVVLIFDKLNSLDSFKSYTKRFTKAVRLTDQEGRIDIEPDSIQMIFGGPEGDEIKQVECKFEVTSADHMQRFIRFMQRYAEANGMEYGEPKKG